MARTDQDRQRAVIAQLTKMGFDLDGLIRQVTSTSAVQSLGEAQRHVREARRALQASLDVKEE